MPTREPTGAKLISTLFYNGFIKADYF